jgi:anti-sigma factor RsiW
VDRGPSAAEVAAARRAAEARAARAARLKAQRLKQRLRAQRLKAKREARAKELRRLRSEENRAGSNAPLRSIGTGPNAAVRSFEPDDGSSSTVALAFAAVAFFLALIVLTLGLVPAYSVPWYRMSLVLEEYGERITLVGGLAVLATGIFLLMVLGG